MIMEDAMKSLDSFQRVLLGILFLLVIGGIIEWAFRPVANGRFNVNSVQVIVDKSSGLCWGIYTNQRYSSTAFGPIPCE
jgi:hypothetical protein